MKSNSPVAIVTGAAKRLGAEIIKSLHANQYNVVIHYRHSEKEAKALCNNCNTIRPHSAIIVQADLNQPKQFEKLIQSSFQKWDRLDVLINNASEYFPTSVGFTTEQQWNDLMNSNLKAPYFLSQAAAPHLKKTKGCIVNMSDVNAVRPLQGYPVYCIAKAGLNTLTQALAKELSPDIRINAVALGPTVYSKTNQNKTLFERPAETQEIANAVLFLIQHTFITGEILNVSGGKIL